MASTFKLAFGQHPSRGVILRLPASTSNAMLKALLRGSVNHDRRAIAQLMSIAENDPRARIKILSALYERTGNAHVIGITGPPGAGKSTLISGLAKHYREERFSVGIVAVDPTSQVTGGALLGDRIRMTDLASDPKVFIRSMATRGQVGGIARATEDVVRILDATSTDYIIVETVGAGQSDVDIKSLAHTTVVVTAPGLGDEIQALKAGIMEIGNIFVVNKADKEDADRSVQEISSMIMMAQPINGWRPRVIKTNALSGDGIPALAEAIKQHAEHTRNSHQTKEAQSERIRREVLEATKRYFEDITIQELESSGAFAKLVSLVARRRMDPYTAARRLVNQFGTRS
jgi:LAO/AO transport system kinase